MSQEHSNSDADLVVEKAANRRYLEMLTGTRADLRGVTVTRGSIWLGTGLPKPNDVTSHPIVGRVALDLVDPDIEHADFYIGPWHKQAEDLAVFSWVAPVAAAFFRPFSDDHELCGHVVATRTMEVKGEDVVGYVDDEVRPHGEQPFQARRQLQVPRAPIAAPKPSTTEPAQPSAPRPIAAALPPAPAQKPIDRSSSSSAPPAKQSTGVQTHSRPSARPPAQPRLRAEEAVRAAIASPRSARLTSTLATLQPDQYDLVTSPPDRPLVLQGNPGTGKTIIAAHRAAYLVHPARQDALERVLLVGPTTRYRDHVRDIIDDLASPRNVKVEGLTDFLSRLRGLKHNPGGGIEGHFLDFDSQIADDTDMVAAVLEEDPKYVASDRQQRTERIYEALRANKVLGNPIAYEADIAHRYQQLPPFHTAAKERRYIPVLAACALSAGVWTERWFDHVIVDEAQDVRPLEWKLLQRVNAGGGWTIVGDVYQRRWDHSYRDWDSLIAHLGLEDADPPVSARVIQRGYRSTRPIMRFANQLLPAEGRRVDSLQDDGPAPTVIRAVAATLAERSLTEATRLIDSYPLGTVAIIAPAPSLIEEQLRRKGWTRDPNDTTQWVYGEQRLACLGSEPSRGLEFDAVVVVEPEDFPTNLGIRGQLYTSLTRANRELAVVHSKPLPDKLKARV